ncbi:MAG: hypothetical protein QXQ76_03980 [Candidatus Bathyarchaeia archaeon]
MAFNMCTAKYVRRMPVRKFIAAQRPCGIAGDSGEERIVWIRATAPAAYTPYIGILLDGGPPRADGNRPLSKEAADWAMEIRIAMRTNMAKLAALRKAGSKVGETASMRSAARSAP